MTNLQVPSYYWSDLEAPTELAKGTATTIYRARLCTTPVAVKVLGTHRADIYDTAAADLRNEAERNARLRHPNIVQFLGLVQVPRAGDPSGLIFELADSKLKCSEYGSNRWKDGVRVITDIARALTYAHSLKIVHRDVKMSQVLFFGSRAKLGDWGLARVVGEGMTGETGTWEFMAPEVIRGEEYDESVDVYSLGVLLFCIVKGADYPYDGEYLTPLQAAMGVAKNGLRPKLGGIKEGVRRIIEVCWADRANERPKMANVVRRLEEVLREGGSKGGWYSWIWG